IKEIAKLCEGGGMPAVAITDNNKLFGALVSSLTLPDFGIQPLVGCDLYVSLAQIEGAVAGRKADAAPVVLLVQNETGYRNLMKLVSKAHLDSDAGVAPQISMANLDGLSDGLLMLTGGAKGPAGRLILDGQVAAAEKLLL